MNRREFLATSAGIAGLALASKAQDVIGANNRLNVGVIGCGGQGTHHLQRLVGTSAVKVVGVCDVYKPRLDNAVRISGAKGFTDYRRLLDMKELDAVWVATPDHWHLKMGLDAMDAGKDVYQEKPLTRYWHEAKEYHRAWLRTKRVVQVGSQDCSREIWWRARDLIREGRLGKLVWSQTSISRNLREGDWAYTVDLKASPQNLDWDAFLGPAEKRPFDPERFFRWRKYWDYSGGIATDLYVHVMHTLCIALGNEFPVRAVSGGCFAVHTDRETPDTFISVIDYPSRHTLSIAGTQANEQGVGVVIRGHEATMYLSGSDIVIRPERISGKENEEKIGTRDVAEAISAHHGDFIDCVRRRDQRTKCDVDLAYKVMVAVDMTIECYRKDKVMRFDPVREEMIG